ncbi:hypothetical protein OS242_16925 [Tumebacillus sp. DT12]|uniref:Spore coat protein n=1 Tax=Tumebacillus lacus TaxID=2995335 RepID=A0ABT3X7Q5_9BACL|nr:hypothetical protein [Tumebacillus lacus]MCX7571630.1 hypothetical protein [Tumebacillus lacus]
MGKKYRNDSDVRLIPYYQYDPEIHEIDTRYLPQSPQVEYDYDPQQEVPAHFEAPQGDYRFVPVPVPVPGGRPRRRRRRRRPPFYGPVPFPAPVPVPIPAPIPTPYPYPYYGGYPYGGGGYPYGGYPYKR